MERKITHYVVKPEHYQHYATFVGSSEEDISESKIWPESRTYDILTEAKVLDLWCTPVIEKQKVNGWYNVYNNHDGTHELRGGFDSKEVSLRFSSEKCIGQIFIDQEIE